MSNKLKKNKAKKKQVKIYRDDFKDLKRILNDVFNCNENWELYYESRIELYKKLNGEDLKNWGLNFLADYIEKIDKKYSQRCLNIFSQLYDFPSVLLAKCYIDLDTTLHLKNADKLVQRLALLSITLISILDESNYKEILDFIALCCSFRKIYEKQEKFIKNKLPLKKIA